MLLDFRKIITLHRVASPAAYEERAGRMLSSWLVMGFLMSATEVRVFDIRTNNLNELRNWRTYSSDSRTASKANRKRDAGVERREGS